VLVSCVDTLKFVPTAVEFEAVVLPKITSRPGVNNAIAPGLSGPNKNDGRPRDDVFVIVGVTLATVTKLSG
jgi:hypothetical protein